MPAESMEPFLLRVELRVSSAKVVLYSTPIIGAVYTNVSRAPLLDSRHHHIDHLTQDRNLIEICRQSERYSAFYRDFCQLAIFQELKEDSSQELSKVIRV